MHNINIKHVVYESSNPGKTLVVTGAVHGNEHCGYKAINRLIEDFDSGKYALESGRLILVPKCNPKAFELEERFFERNLNRYLLPKEEKTYYEDYIDPILCNLLDQADFLLDLHSYASPGKAFIFLGNKNDEEAAYARDLGVRDFVYGWAETYSNNEQKEDDNESMGTTEYTRSKGGFGVTLECGQHLNEDAPDIGYNAALRAMNHLGLLKLELGELEEEKENQRLVKMKEVYYRCEGDKLAKEYIHFDPVSKGEVLVYDADNKPKYTAPCNGYVVLPKANSPVGSECFYFGEDDGF